MSKPVLKPATIYVSDNGRLICLECAGASAKYTGRDISGQRVMALTAKDRAEWVDVFPHGIECERGCTHIAA